MTGTAANISAATAQTNAAEALSVNFMPNYIKYKDNAGKIRFI